MGYQRKHEYTAEPKKWHMNTLRFSAYYEYKHERGYDMQHYNLLTADGAPDKRNRYDSRPGAVMFTVFLQNIPLYMFRGCVKPIYCILLAATHSNSTLRNVCFTDWISWGMNGCLIKLP